LPRKIRKQRVALRFRRREQLKHRWRRGLTRSISGVLILGFGIWLFSGGHSFSSRFIEAHRPVIDVNSPQTLAGLPINAQLPADRFWLWFPGAEIPVQKRICSAFRSVRRVRFERHIIANHLVIRLEPRIPLVVWNGAGFDQEGVLFAITPGTWGAMPHVNFPNGINKSEISAWLARLSHVTEIWSQVSTVTQTPNGEIDMTLKTGTVVKWGTPEDNALTRKAQTLARVLDDAHNHLGGTAIADLRFFDQERIIVKPKG
jgi:hypothetical protein